MKSYRLGGDFHTVIAEQQLLHHNKAPSVEEE